MAAMTRRHVVSEKAPIGPRVAVFGLLLIVIGSFALQGLEAPIVGWIAIATGVLTVIGGLASTPRGKRDALFRQEMTQGSTPTRRGLAVAFTIGGIFTLIGLLGLIGVIGGATEAWALPAGVTILVLGFLQLKTPHRD